MIEILLILIILLCMVGTAFFAGIETGVISIHRMRLRHYVREGLPGAEILEGFLAKPDRLLGTTLVGTNLCMVIVAVVHTSLGQRASETWGAPVAAVIATILVLVCCVYLPKAWFQSRPFHRCRRFAKALRISEIILKPLSAIVVSMPRWLVPGSEATLSRAAPFVTREDLKVLAHEGEAHGVLSSTERGMIHRVFDLSNKRANQIMIPRDQMTIVSHDASLDDFFDIAKASEFTRMPILNREEDAFVGTINVFFVLSYEEGNRDQPVSWFGRPPLFVHENTPVDDILPMMRRHRQPMCLVMNDRDSVTGLITTEDILEEIVGAL
jgi:CBS domain containing-hemolysin-like protein